MEAPVRPLAVDAVRHLGALPAAPSSPDPDPQMIGPVKKFSFCPLVHPPCGCSSLAQPGALGLPQEWWHVGAQAPGPPSPAFPGTLMES